MVTLNEAHQTPVILRRRRISVANFRHYYHHLGERGVNGESGR